jgi:transcriptional regulator with XRE-family HTH domain
MPDRLKEVIKNARVGKKYSQTQLGQLTGVWGTYIGQIEKGVRKPSDEVCKKLATALDLDWRCLQILTLIERAETRDSKQLLSIVYKILKEPVVAGLMDERIEGTTQSIYNLVKLILELSPHNQRIVSDLVYRMSAPQTKPTKSFQSSR